MLELIFIALISVLIYLTIWWVFASIHKNNSFADVAWGTNFIVIGSIVLLFSDQPPKLVYIVFFAVVVWAVRISWHIGRRNLSRPEDRRYLVWRKKGGKYYQWESLIKIFWLQGLLALIISAPMIVVVNDKNALVGHLTLIGVLIWGFGFIYESIADKQFRNFLKTSSKGSIMQSGLWKYSRHPNYFGEIVQWLGLFIVVSPVKYGLYAIVSPLLIMLLLKFVSGVPLAESELSKNPKYKKYMAKTPPIVPLKW